MRTTWKLDDDVLAAVKEIAGRQPWAAGEVASNLIRESLTGGRVEEDDPSDFGFEAEIGFASILKQGGVVTNELVNRLRERTQDL